MAKLHFSQRDRLCLTGLFDGRLDDIVKVGDLRALAAFDLLSVEPDEDAPGTVIIALTGTGVAYAKAIAAENAPSAKAGK